MEAEQVVAALRAALMAAADTPDDEYLERNVGEPAVAAAAIVLAKHGGRQEVLEDVELESVVPQLPDDIFPLVVRAIDRTLQANSEARRLWEQAGEEAEWIGGLQSLMAEAGGLN
jgi:hypothetical protein